MSLLTLDVGGADEMDVRVSRSGHAEPRQTGTRRYTLFGRERSMIRAETMVVPLVLYLQSATDAATVRRLFANGAPVVCHGDVFNNASADLTCSGEITDEMTPGLVTDPWVLSLTLYEIDTSGVLG